MALMYSNIISVPQVRSVTLPGSILEIACTPGWLLQLHTIETLEDKQWGVYLTLSICSPEVRSLEMICIHFEHSKEDFNLILRGVDFFSKIVRVH